MRRMTNYFCLVLVGLLAINEPVFGADSRSLSAKVKIVQQTYCSGDADVFTVSLQLKVKIRNIGDASIYIRNDMVPYVARVADSIDAAESANFRYEVSATRYPTSGKKLRAYRVDPGREVTLQVGYDVVARYRADRNIGKTVPPGSYALQLVLKPEYQEQAPRQTKGPEEPITTDPFSFTVPDRPEVIACR